MMENLDQFEDLLLKSARNGDYKTIEEIVKADNEGKVCLNINCKGQSKYNFGWTPLHLASYFGHITCVESLLHSGAIVDIQNDSGDTPLHKAALTNRENIVMMLLEHGASVSVINGEGLKASDLARKSQVKKLIVAAEKAEQRGREEKLLHAAREGNFVDVKTILQDSNTPNINCVDTMGNTSLHCASYRNHMNVAVILLQNGCDTSIKNYAGQSALDLVQSQQMEQVLSVPSVRSFSRKVTRFEGPLLRKMRIVGWRMVWAVLERGVLTYFNSRADASSGVCRRDYKYLDGAKVIPSLGGDQAVFFIQYNEGTRHRLAALSDPVHSASVNRQKWVCALEDHMKFSTHYIQHGFSIDTDDDDDDEKSFKPLGCMEDALGTAKAHQDLLEQQIQEVMALISYLEERVEDGNVHNVIKKFTSLNTTARSMFSSLNHCLSLLKQQEEVRELQLNEEKEKVRVLEESLRVLATEHHELEESIASRLSSSSDGPSIYNTPANSFMSLSKPRRFYSTDGDDEFLDVFHGDDDTCTLRSIPSPCESECSTNTLVSCMSSLPLDPQPTQNYLIDSFIPEDEDLQQDVTISPSASFQDIIEGTYNKLASKSSEDKRNKEPCSHLADSSFTISSSTAQRNSESTTLTISLTENLSNSISSASKSQSVLTSVPTSPNSHHESSTPPPETPLIRTSDLSEHGSNNSGDSDTTISSQSRDDAAYNKEQNSSFSLISLSGSRYKGPYAGPRSCWRSWGRVTLPAPQFQRNDFSLWSVLRQCIGKELSKITMPIVFNEPLSFLQRMSEYMEYAWLLDKADKAGDPVQRMEYVTAFALSGLASNWERLGKPFNPLLGETYELQRDQYRIICEQVSHHPPVSAFNSDSENWTFHGSIHPKLKFWGKSVEIQPKGVLTVQLPNHGEAYTWSNVNCCVHNIIVGKLWIEQYGTMEITNHATGHKSVLTFKTAGWFSKDLHRVEGFILDKHKKKQKFLYGKWTEFLRSADIDAYTEYMETNAHKRNDKSGNGSIPDEAGGGGSGKIAHSPFSSSSSSSKKVLSKLNSITASFKMSTDVEAPVVSEERPPEDHEEGSYPRTDSTYSINIPGSITLWEADPRPESSAQYYHFTLFAMSLNEMDDQIRRQIALSDCRLRPDIRLLEEGDIDQAAVEKSRLEEKQRTARKSRKKGKEDYKSRWFEQGQNPFTGQDDWLYGGGYWDRNYSDIHDIF